MGMCADIIYTLTNKTIAATKVEGGDDTSVIFALKNKFGLSDEQAAATIRIYDMVNTKISPESKVS